MVPKNGPRSGTGWPGRAGPPHSPFVGGVAPGEAGALGFWPSRAGRPPPLAPWHSSGLTRGFILDSAGSLEAGSHRGPRSRSLRRLMAPTSTGVGSTPASWVAPSGARGEAVVQHQQHQQRQPKHQHLRQPSPYQQRQQQQLQRQRRRRRVAAMHHRASATQPAPLGLPQEANQSALATSGMRIHSDMAAHCRRPATSALQLHKAASRPRRRSL